MSKYKIKKYYLKKEGKKSSTIWATVFKYRFGFIVDIQEQKLDSSYRAEHEIYLRYYYRQNPVSNKEAKIILKTLKLRI